MKTTSISKMIELFDSSLKLFEEFIIAYGILTIVAISIANAICRNFFNLSLMWGEEVCQSIIVLLTFVGVGYAARKGRHIRMSALFDMLDKQYRKILMIFISIITSGTLFYLAYLAYQYTIKIKMTSATLPILQIQSYYIILCVPFGLIVAGIEFGLTARSNIIKKDIYLSTEVVDGYEEEILDN